MLSKMIKYRVKFLRANWPVHSETNFNIYALTPQEATKMAYAKLDNSKWKLDNVCIWDNYIPSWQR